MIEKRKFRRSPISTKIIIEGKECKVSDFSVGGCTLYPPSKLWPINNRYAAEFVFGSVMIDVNVLLIYYDEASNRYGSEFFYKYEDDKAVMESFISLNRWSR